MDVYQRRRLVALSAVAALFIIIVLLIRGCGGDDEPETTPLSGATGLGGATSQTQEAYIASADAICLETNTVIADIDEASAVAVAEEAAAVQGQLEQLQTLLPPQDGQDALDAFVSALARQAEQLNRQTVAIEREDQASADEIALKVDAAATDAGQAGRRFGFEVCGDPDQVGESTGEETGEPPETETTPTEPVAPTETTPVVPETTIPAPDTGTEGGVGTEPTPPPDTGDTDSGSGGVSP